MVEEKCVRASMWERALSPSFYFSLGGEGVEQNFWGKKPGYKFLEEFKNIKKWETRNIRNFMQFLLINYQYFLGRYEFLQSIGKSCYCPCKLQGFFLRMLKISLGWRWYVFGFYYFKVIDSMRNSITLLI